MAHLLAIGLEICGVVLVVIGVYMIYAPAAYIVAGIILVVGAQGIGGGS